MSAYFDSSVVTKWYLPEADSAAALRVRARFSPPAVLTHLHRVELAAAWHLKVFRREIRLETIVHALGDLAADVEAGIWEAPAYDLADVFEQADTFAKRHAATLGVRTLDILHVAAAACLDATAFVTADRRQAALADATGMRVIRLRAPR